MSDEIWFMICWFTCWRKSEFHAYSQTNTPLFYQLDSAFLEHDNCVITPLINRGHFFFPDTQKYNSVEHPLSLSAYEYSVIRSKFIPRDTQSPFRVAVIQADGFPWWLRTCWELGPAQLGKEPMGRFSKTKADSTKLLEIAGVYIPTSAFKSLTHTRVVFRGTGWHSLKILRGWISSQTKDTLLTIIEYSQSMYLIERRWSICHQGF